MKAAFIKNFVKFIEWPSRPTGSLTLCILGEDPFREVLKGPGDVGGGRSLSYRRIGKLMDADGCQILFVTRKEAQALPEILAALAGREILTISDGDGLAKGGLMIGFLLEEQTGRFVAILLTSGLLVFDQYRESRRTLGEDAETQASVIGSNCSAALLFGDAKAAGEILASLKALPSVRTAGIYDKEGGCSPPTATSASGRRRSRPARRSWGASSSATS